MSKHWKKKLKIKNMEREEYRENITSQKKELIEVRNKENEQEPTVIFMREFKNKFVNVQGYRLTENSTVHCADEKQLKGNAGDYYVQLDRVQEFILPAEIFRKMFLLKTETEK